MNDLRTLSPTLLALCLLGCPASESGTNDKPDAADKSGDGSPDKADDSTPAADGTDEPAAEGSAGADTTGPAEAGEDDAKQRATAKRAKAKAKITDHDDAELQATRKQINALLNEGRKLVKEGDYTDGMAKYEAILKLDPHHGKALAELGWAEYKAGNLTEAHAHTLRALALADDDKRRGMILYNLGRIAEDRGQIEEAITNYEVSLSLRPNDTVQARLDNLTHVEDAAGNTPDGGGAVDGAHAGSPGLSFYAHDLADMEAACRKAQSEGMCGSDDAPPCEVMGAPAGDETWGMLLIADMGIMECYHPFMKTDSGWVVFESALLGQWGSEVDEGVDALESRVVNNDAGEFLVFTFSSHLYERTWDSIDEADEDGVLPPDDVTDYEGVVICHRDGDQPRCTPAIVTALDYNGGDKKYRATVELVGDQVHVSAVSNEGGVAYNTAGADFWATMLILAEGQHPFSDLAKP